MRKWKRLLATVLAGGLIGALLPVGVALAHPEAVTTNTTLTEDHVGSIVVDADGITLDCAGHTITPEGGDVHGIYVYGNDVTVTDCHVSGFANVGITFEGVHGGLLVGSSASGNGAAGVRLSGSTGVTVTRTDSYDNELSGFFLRSGSSENLIIDVSSTANGAGLGLFNGANNNEVRGSTFNDNGNIGISVTESHGNLIQGNTVTNTVVGASGSGEGIWLANASGNVLAGNGSASNEANGFFLTGSSGNHLQGNIAENNGNHGYSLHDAHENTLKGNIGLRNRSSGFQIGQACGDEENCEANFNLIDGNAADRNEGGIRLLNAYGNDVIRNVTRFNTLGGIGLTRSGLNLISQNTSRNNGNDLFQDALSQDLGNTFANNTYKTQIGVD